MRLIIGGTGPARVDQTLLKTIVRAHKWFNDLVSGRVHNMAEIASKEGVDKSYVSRVVNLAFLAPDIIESIISGRQPADLNVEKLTKRIDLPLDWVQQHQLLGFVQSPKLTDKIPNRENNEYYGLCLFQAGLSGQHLQPDRANCARLGT